MDGIAEDFFAGRSRHCGDKTNHAAHWYSSDEPPCPGFPLPVKDGIVYLEDLPEGTVIAPGAFKPQKGVPLKIAGVPVGTCDIDIDDDGNLTYSAEFKRGKITPELYDIMFGARPAVHSNVFDVSEEDQQRADPSVGTVKAPFRLPRS